MDVPHSSFWGEQYWSDRYANEQTQWDAGTITTPLKEYIDQLTDRNIRVLIPGCGNGYEAEYLWKAGFSNTYVIDLSKEPLNNLKQRVIDFPGSQLVQGDFFQLEDSFDLIIEQTFFCSLNPKERPVYAKKMFELLKPKGKLVGVLFEDKLFEDHPPYGGHREEYKTYFEDFFDFKTFERCYNSIKPRQGRELFINLIRNS